MGVGVAATPIAVPGIWVHLQIGKHRQRCWWKKWASDHRLLWLHCHNPPWGHHPGQLPPSPLRWSLPWLGRARQPGDHPPGRAPPLRDAPCTGWQGNRHLLPKQLCHLLPFEKCYLIRAGRRNIKKKLYFSSAVPKACWHQPFRDSCKISCRGVALRNIEKQWVSNFIQVLLLRQGTIFGNCLHCFSDSDCS